MGGDFNNAIVYSLEKQIETFRLEHSPNEPIFVLKGFEDDILCSGSDNGNLLVWDSRCKEKVMEAKDHELGTITDLVYHPESHLMLSTSSAGILAVYDLRKDFKNKDRLYARSDVLEDELNCVGIIEVYLLAVKKCYSWNS